MKICMISLRRIKRMIASPFILSLIMLNVCTVSCSDDEPLDKDPDQGQTLPVHHNERLVGSWSLVKPLGNGAGCRSVINLNEDGTGSDDSQSLKWSTTDGKLEIVFADGSKLRTAYQYYGAVLALADYAEYEMKLPFVGAWTAANAGKSFSGTDFFYHFDRNGDGGVFTFGADGLWQYQEGKWDRSKEGMDWMKGRFGDNEHLSYQATDGGLTLEGKGEFVQTPPYYGVWKSVSSSAGVIQTDDYAFSTVEIYKYQEKTYFYCTYWDLGNLDGKYHQQNYQTFPKVVFSKQQQMIILLPEETEDATTLYFRFYYSKDAKKVFMDLSKNIDFKEYVRYEYQTQK